MEAFARVLSTILAIVTLYGAIADSQETLSRGGGFNFTDNNHILGGNNHAAPRNRGNKRRENHPSAATSERPAASPYVFSIPLRHAEGSAWGMVGEVKVGTDPTSVAVEVMFDTQSSNTLMFHPDITNSNGGLFDYKSLFRKDNVFYNPGKSTSAVRTERGEKDRFEIRYTDGSVYGGGTVDDLITVGPIMPGPITFSWVDYMNKAAALNRGGDFGGIIGLGSPDFTMHGRKMMTALFDLLANREDKDALKAPVFAFYVSETGETGEIMFGGHNKDLLAEEGGGMTYFPALSLSPGGYDSSQSWEYDWPVSDIPGSSNQIEFIDPDGILDHGNNSGRRVKEVDGEEGPHKQNSLTLQGRRSPSKSARQRGNAAAQQHINVVWGIQLKELSVSDKPVATGAYALFSSTSPYGIAFPRPLYMENLRDQIGNGAELTDDGELIIGCDKLESNLLPDLTLAVGEEGHTLSFTPQEYFPNVVNSEEGHKKKKKGKHNKSMVCSSFFGVTPDDGSMKSTTSMKYDVDDVIVRFGIPFMKKYYVEYDYGANWPGKGGAVHNMNRDPARVGIALSNGRDVVNTSGKKGRKQKSKRSIIGRKKGKKE